MSLTNHLKDTQSPVRQFIRDQFPNTRALTKDANPGLKGAATTRPSNSVKIPTTIGGAFDYRARYFFPAPESRSLFAWKGALMASGQMINDAGSGSKRATLPRSGVDFDLYTGEPMDPGGAEKETKHIAVHPGGGVISDFFSSLDQFLAEKKPAGRQLDGESEKSLARYCYVLALFEEVFRAGPWPTSILFREPYQSIEELLDAVPDELVDDIAALSVHFFRRFEHCFGENATLNPTFEGSQDVGGADGDLILARCLIDFKVTVNARLDPEWLRQLLGYVLLDYSDTHALEYVAIYLARQDVLLRWPLDDFIQALSDDNPDISSLRREFKEVVQAT